MFHQRIFKEISVHEWGMLPKILIRKEKKEIIKGKEWVIKKTMSFFIADPSKEYHCNEGVIQAKDLKKKSGSMVQSNLKEDLVLLDADILDCYKRIKRTSQLIPLKDIGYIIAATGINHDSVIFPGKSCADPLLPENIIINVLIFLE